MNSAFRSGGDPPPGLLYKFRRFSPHLISELCNSQTYFSSPDNFNDPLDSKPAFVSDLHRSELEELLGVLLEESDGVDSLQGVIASCRYNATYDETDHERMEAVYVNLLAGRVTSLLRNWIGSHGVLSLASRWDCALMWSHYADQHAGVCLEYSTRDHVLSNLMPVDYERPRSIRLRDVFDWKVRRDSGARRRIIEIAFLTKAPAWSYEQEWRSVSRRPGVAPLRFDLVGIYFGQRCSQSVRTAIVKMMHDATPGVVLYDVSFCENTFDLRRSMVDVQEILQVGLRRSAALAFGRLPLGPGLGSQRKDFEPEDEFPRIT